MESERTPEPKQQEQDRDKTVDARDLAAKPENAFNPNPEEILDNPAVTPQTLDEPSDLRDDLKP